MKTLHYTNCFFYVITLGAYATIYYAFFGMFAQIALGIVQLILAVLVLLNLNRLQKIIERHMFNYWRLALSNLLILLIIFNTSLSDYSTVAIAFVFVIPMLIATYFVYITHLIRKQ